jgi:hypothetical protein
MDYQSAFSPNKILTDSSVNRTNGCGLLFYLISAISVLLRVFNASIAAFKVGIAFLRMASASFLASYILDAFIFTNLSSSSTTDFTLLASTLSFSSLTSSLSISIAF